jgi:sec-independent protein translocase protein TatC
MSVANNDLNENGREQTFISHLIELRIRLLHSLYSVLVLFCLLFYFSNDLYNAIATPLLEKLPVGSSMIATEVASPFLAPFKLTLFTAIFLAIPYLLYQIWSFVAPGLYKNEKRFMMPLLITSVTLFYTGTAFAFFVVFPLLFAFLTAVAPEGVTVMTDINHYLNFILKLFFAFGVSFEIPVATFLLIWSGFISVKELKAKRPYIIISAFVFGMLLTPPDVISQILLAVPIWILFELGLVLSNRFIPQNDAQEDKMPVEDA